MVTLEKETLIIRSLGSRQQLGQCRSAPRTRPLGHPRLNRTRRDPAALPPSIISSGWETFGRERFELTAIPGGDPVR
jgi:hypothetical protein